MSVTLPPSEFYDLDDSINSCFLCGQPKYKTILSSKYFGFPVQFSKCRCGIVKQTPMPNQKFFEWFFNSDLFISAKQSGSDKIWGFYDYFNDENCRLATSKLRYKKLHKYFTSDRPLDLMKIGPSTGTFLNVANCNGHKAIGCDISSKFIEYAKSEYNVKIDKGRFEYLSYKDEQFDIIMLFNVIENIPNQDEFLRSVKRTLRVGGYFILNYVDMKNNIIAKFQGEKYFLYRPPICYLFDNISINKLLEKYGFEVQKKYMDIRYLHLEKIFLLLGWPQMFRIFKYLKMHRIIFPIYAYPPNIMVSRRIS